jgi:predicted XRE-type DNA-binding protein
VTEIEAGSTNVYADLGRADADEMLIKAQLASRIGAIIKRRHLTQVEAAEIIGMPQPKLSGMLRGQFRGISEAKMLSCLTRLGRDVRIVVGPARRRSGVGQIEVVSG